jgi:hypothetical protein
VTGGTLYWYSGDQWVKLATLQDGRIMSPSQVEGRRIGRAVVVAWLAGNPHLPVPDVYRASVAARRRAEVDVAAAANLLVGVDGRVA